MSHWKPTIPSNKTLIHIYDKTIKFGLIFLILFAPLAFGSVYVWAFSIIEIIVFSMMTILVARKWVQGGKISFPLFFPIIAFLALIFLQMIPLPPPAIKFISPKTHRVYCQTLDGYPNSRGTIRLESNGIPERDVQGQGLEVRGGNFRGREKEGFFENWRTLSLYPHATRTELLKIMSYLGVFLLIVNYVDSKKKLIGISTVIAFSGILVALVGMAQKVAGVPKIYGFWEPHFKSDASFFGPFVNPNHFAGYMELVIPLSIGLLISKWRHVGESGLRGIRGFLIKIGTEEGCKLILFGFLVVLMVGALFLSSSRGGVISFLGSVMFFLFLFVKKEKERRNFLVMVVLLISVFSLLIWMGIRPLLEEFSSVQNLSRDYDIQYRFQNWRDSATLIRDFPLFGVGLEAFSSIFPTYKTSGLQYYYLYLENDYLQLLCEMGILGCGVLLWFIASLFLRVGSGPLGNEAEGMSSAHYISLCGCLTGVVAIMIHSFWDFNMHIPSNGLLLSMIIGLALAGVRIESEKYSKHLLGRTSRGEIP